MNEGCRHHGHRFGLGSTSQAWVVPRFELTEMSTDPTEKVVESIDGEVQLVRREGVWALQPDVTVMIEKEGVEVAEADLLKADMELAVKLYLAGDDA